MIYILTYIVYSLLMFGLMGEVINSIKMVYDVRILYTINILQIFISAK